jgi:glycosyltransferase involved in cell wall biosynthesis
MRLLSYLNVSNGDDLERDSGFLFQRALLEELCKRHEVTMVAPIGTSRLLNRVAAIELEWPKTKYGVRFGWPWLGLARALESAPPPDVVLNNQCELTSALRLLLLEVYGSPIPIATYFHYLAVLERDGAVVVDPSLDDLGCGEILWSRQLEAARCSAATIIGTDYGVEFLRRGLARDDNQIDITVIPPPVIPGLWVGNDSGATILYNHRLYAHYGTESTMRALERVCRRTGARVIVTDPTQCRSGRRTRLDDAPRQIAAQLASAPWAEVIDASAWADYAAVVARSTLGMAPDRPGALWSMSAIDLMSIGRPVLVPSRSGLGRELGPDLCFADSEELERKMVNLLVDPEERAVAGERCRRFASRFSIDAITAQFDAVFDRVLRARQLAQRVTVGATDR